MSIIAHWKPALAANLAARRLGNERIVPRRGPSAAAIAEVNDTWLTTPSGLSPMSSEYIVGLSTHKAALFILEKQCFEADFMVDEVYVLMANRLFIYRPEFSNSVYHPVFELPPPKPE
jgi:hypothetical protein